MPGWSGVAPLLVPVPDRATVSVPLVALLVTVRFAEAEPSAVGAKVTLAVQDAPAARELPQVLVSRERRTGRDRGDRRRGGAGVGDRHRSAPRWSDPTASLPNDTEVGDAVSVAVAALVPVPDRATVSEALVALLATVSVRRGRTRSRSGVNVTVAVQDAAGGEGTATGVGLGERRRRP